MQCGLHTWGFHWSFVELYFMLECDLTICVHDVFIVDQAFDRSPVTFHGLFHHQKGVVFSGELGQGRDWAWVSGLLCI